MAAKGSPLSIPTGPGLLPSGPAVGVAAPWRLDGSEARARIAHPYTWISTRVSPPPPEIATELSGRGLEAWHRTEAPTSLLRRAALWIGLEPSLAAISAQVVGDIHLLCAAPGYDVSHSEPRWRRRIFVSVPERSDDLGALRLAESVMHEAMHLHLTNHEIAVPLVTEFRRCMKSPWRAEPRSYQGVLHGLFVFTCLETYFRGIASMIGDDEGTARHRQSRLDEIRTEVASLDLAQLCSGLTFAGAALARQWHHLACAGWRGRFRRR